MSHDSSPTSRSVRWRLFAMMVLQFFVWGAWLPLIYGYLPSLGFTAVQQSWILNAFPIAAIVGLFVGNQFADRRFAAQRFLGFSHLVGGLALIALGFTRAFWPFLGLMSIYCLLYVPTLSIVNSIAFAHLRNPQREFGLVRAGGTVGWILAAWPFTFILVDWARVNAQDPQGLVNWLGVVLGSGLTGAALKEATRWTFLVAGAGSLALAALSLFLPDTPPKRAVANGVEKRAWLEAGRLLRHPFVMLLWILALVDAFVLNCYFNWTGVFLVSPAVGIAGNWVMPVMSLSQIAEIPAMMILGAALARLGWRTTLTIGILGHTLRFGIYAFFPDQIWLIVLVQLVHGVCYAFFFAAVYIFVDRYFPRDVRSSAQGLFNLVILGLGALLANSLCPWLLQSVFTREGVTDYRSLFLLPSLISLAAAVVLILFFRPPPDPVEPKSASVTV